MTQEAKSEKIGVIGLGYVGLPVALSFAKKYPGTIGFDIDSQRVKTLEQGIDSNGDVDADDLKNTDLTITDEEQALEGVSFFVITVPTPVDKNKRPDLHPLMEATEIIGRLLTPGAVVVCESTVYPGVTEDVCGEILQQTSGLKRGEDFFLGYSPERINPGDREHQLEKIIKVVSGEDEKTLERIATAYSQIIEAGIHRASSIKVAEAAKVIENTQRDLNIALMNELAVIFDRMNISTRDVLAAAQTKWNFLSFHPGLVGGHCIGVDPYYLTTKAEQLGYHPQVILAGRRINDGMGPYIGQRLVKLLVNAGIQPKSARVGILGVTFKENIADTRNTKVPGIYQELKEFGAETLVHDPLADPASVHREYGIELSSWESFSELDGLVLAVCHQQFLDMPLETLTAGIKSGGVVVDVKSVVDRNVGVNITV